MTWSNIIFCTTIPLPLSDLPTRQTWHSHLISKRKTWRDKGGIEREILEGDWLAGGTCMTWRWKSQAGKACISWRICGGFSFSLFWLLELFLCIDRPGWMDGWCF